MKLTFSLTYINPLNERHSQNGINLFDFSVFRTYSDYAVI